MKILVVNNMVPFLQGGAEKLASNLVRNLRRYGHDADLLRIPFAWKPAERIYDEMLACRMMRLYNVDRVIGLKFPAYLIPHRNKTLWLIHQYRQAYDLANSTMSHIPRDAEGDNLRRTIATADRECFGESDEIFVISNVVQQRLAKFNDYEGQVLHPPLDDADLFTPQREEKYIFCGGRINACKRQHLLVEAMRYSRSEVRLLIAGPPDSPDDGRRLEQLVNRHGLADRIQLEFGFHPREKLAQWVNHAAACAYIPFDEDYGYVTLEAFYAGKPMITAEDSGGVLDFVRDGVTGVVAAPDAQSLGAAIDKTIGCSTTRRQWGEAARQHIHQRNINWPETVKRLVA